MNTKHTPGPWHLAASLNPKMRGLCVRPPEEAAFRADIAFIHEGGELQALANAQLIASAPALYRKAENLLQVMGGNGYGIEEAQKALGVELERARGLDPVQGDFCLECGHDLNDEHAPECPTQVKP